ncbi:MAG: hypothetical protein IR160_11025 [Salinibacterium sp.]|nr:hypothetical protein [Salinibacterium sp.]MBF0673103.1 hypothetical protein [Salinibacterium sp.]
MRTPPTPHRLAEVLPGSWGLGATSQLFWLDGRHGEPRFTFRVAGTSPLRLTETIEFAGLDGRPRTLTGKTRWVRDEFAWRGSGTDALVTRRWSAAGIDETGSILVMRNRRTRAVASGIDILVREGAELGELRTIVASTATELGISAEDFASLTWIRSND